MIKITQVQGRCLLMDGFTCRIPRPGMGLHTTGSDKVYILMTGPMGAMTLRKGGDSLRLKGNSILRIRGSLAPESARRPGTLDEAKLWVGRIWAKIRGPEPLEEIVENATIGVRG